MKVYNITKLTHKYKICLEGRRKTSLDGKYKGKTQNYEVNSEIGGGLKRRDYIIKDQI